MPSHLSRSKSSSDGPLDEAVKNHVNELTHLTNVAPDLGLDGGVHLDLFNCKRYQFIKNVRHL